MKTKMILFIFSLCLPLLLEAQNREHPCLILTKAGVEQIKMKQGRVPLFDKSQREIETALDKVMRLPMEVPVPKDAGGGVYARTA